jgi:hypothetical protein
MMFELNYLQIKLRENVQLFCLNTNNPVVIIRRERENERSGMPPTLPHPETTLMVTPVQLVHHTTNFFRKRGEPAQRCLQVYY